MPVIKVSKNEDVDKRFKWKNEDEFVVANWQNNTTLAHFVGEELYEIIGTEKEPVTYKEMKDLGVDVDALYVAGQLGVKVDGNFVFYKDTYEQYDDTYYDEPVNTRGFSFQNGRLETDNRNHQPYDEKPIVVNPGAVSELTQYDQLRAKYANTDTE